MAKDYFCHESAYIDEPVEIGAGTTEVRKLIIAEELLKA